MSQKQKHRCAAVAVQYIRSLILINLLSQPGNIKLCVCKLRLVGSEHDNTQKYSKRFFY